MWDGPAVIARIGDAPESYPAWAATRTASSLIRKATIQRFPYVIAFEKHEQHVLILNPSLRSVCARFGS